MFRVYRDLQAQQSVGDGVTNGVDRVSNILIMM